MFAPRRQQLFTVLILSVISNVQNTRSRTSVLCNYFELEPEVRHNIGLDKKFQIKLDDNVKYFVPGDAYTITISGVRPNQHFNKFYLTVEAEDGYSSITVNGRSRNQTYQNAGTFQLLSNTFGRLSEKCPNLIQPTNTEYPKRKIQVEWKSPNCGGCVTLKALLQVHQREGKKEYGVVQHKICSVHQKGSIVPTLPSTSCCACGEAKYEMIFEGLWSGNTNNNNNKNNNNSEKSTPSFSDVIGASHSAGYKLWNYGSRISDGLKLFMSKGTPLKLESELKDQSEHIRTIIKARGISYPMMGGKTFAVFRVDSRHHLISLVSRLDSTKELNVGVSAFELCLANCTWIQNSVVNLYPWIEKGGIVRKIHTHPIARLYITRQSLYDDDCEMVNDGTNQQSDEEEGQSENDDDTDDDDDEDESFDDEDADDEEENCILSNWSEWTDCNNSCGKGERSRWRKYKYNSDRCKKQNDDILQEIEECVGIDCPESSESDYIEDEMCRTSGWSEWSPCSKSCGRGRKARYRSLLSQAAGNNIEGGTANTTESNIHLIELQCGHVSLVEERVCGQNQPACTDRLYHPPKYCIKRPKTGVCGLKLSRWYYNKNLDDCEPFSFTGCGGNNNNFHSYEDCLTVCKPQTRHLLQPS